MSPRGRRILWTLIGLGTLVRLVWAFNTTGAAFDQESFRIVRHALGHDPLGVYGAVNQGFYRWPYPPAFFAWFGAAGGLAHVTGLRFDGWFQVAPIACDAGLAWVVARLMVRRGCPERVVLAGAGLVALGPSFLVTSGYHGQIDSVATLPALAAVLVWGLRTVPSNHPERLSRALAAGLLIGLGGAIKTVPLAMVLALLPTARGRREAAVLIVAAAAVPLAFLAPFLIHDSSAVVHSLQNRGFPGLGGISLIAQPALARSVIEGAGPPGSGVTLWLVHHGWLLPVLAVLALAAVFARRRPAPLDAAVIVWLALLVFGVNFALQYAVWLLPFAIAAGRLRRAAALQLLLVPAAVLFYAAPWKSGAAVTIYAATMIAVFLALAVWLAAELRALSAPATPSRSRTAGAGP